MYEADWLSNVTGTYLRPVPQEAWNVNDLPVDFCFRHLRQNVASKKGEIPDRIKLTYKGIPLRDSSTPSDVNVRPIRLTISRALLTFLLLLCQMKNGETVLFFIGELTFL
jgi:hypothetical protein